MPHYSDVGNEKSTEVPLIRAQVPHSIDLVVHLLMRQLQQLLVLDESTSQLQIAIQFCCFVRSELHRNTGLYG